jgi:uncharacterized protein YciI
LTDSPLFLYTTRPSRLGMLTEGATEEEASIVSAHFDYLKGLAAQGVLLLAGRTQDADATTFGIVLFRAAGESEARAMMENDPAVSHGVMLGELHPYRIAILGRLNPEEESS